MNAVRSIVLLLYLSIAAVYDWRTRKVPNLLHLIFLPIVVIEAIFEADWSWPAFIANVAVVAALFYRWQRGDYGGADVKAAMLMAACMPDNYVMPISTALGLLAAYSRRHAVERTRFIPWLLIGTLAYLTGHYILTGGLP